MVALGYLGDAEDLPEDLKKMETAERSRLPVNKIARRGTWDEQKQL